MKLNLVKRVCLVLLFGLPSLAHAQFTFTTNNGSIIITGYTGPGGTVVIPETTNGFPVTSIGTGAFICQPLTRLTLPSSILSIGNDAFSGCISLTNAILDTNLTTIGAGAFEITSLTAITIPASVTNIGIAAFVDCAALTNIAVDILNPNYSSLSGVLFNKSQTVLVQYPGGSTNCYTIPGSVTNIGDSAFCGCNFLTNVIIPFGVTAIGNSTFSGCNGLTELVVPASVSTINGSAFESCQNLSAIYFQGLPPRADPWIFAGDSMNLTVYYLPGTSGWPSMYGDRNTAPGSGWPFTFATTNGTIAVTGYTGSGSSLTIPATINNLAVTSIRDGAFADSSLTDVILPDSIISIGNNAFTFSFNLASIQIGRNVKTIGEQAFYNCNNLSALTIPNSVTNIGDYAFANCLNLTNVTLGSQLSTIGNWLFGDCSSLASINLPESVTGIGDAAFMNCSGLINVTIPQSVTNIGDWAFAYCTSLPAIELPANLGNIGTAAFAWCAKLTEVDIGSNVTSIGDWAFATCSSLTNIAVDSFNPTYSSFAGILFNQNQTTLIQYPSGKPGDYTIGGTVTNIQDDAFADCATLTSVTIPQNVMRIGASAFSDCPSLTNIAVDALNANYRSEAGVLFNKDETLLLECPGGIVGSYMIPGSVTNIVDYAFYACYFLTSISIPFRVTYIGDSAFYFCDGLTSVTIPPSVTSIGTEAFSACANLTNIVVDPRNANYSTDSGVLFNKDKSILIQCPGGITGCYAIPRGVSSVGDWAFESCTCLTNLTVPASVSGIETSAFFYCTSLSQIYFEGNAPSIDQTELIWFDNATAYYLPGTTGWGSSIGTAMIAQWYLPFPLILSSAGNGGIQSNAFGFTISWATNIAVVVEACTNLSNPAWQPVATNTLSNGTFYFSDPQWTNYPGRFYRISSP